MEDEKRQRHVVSVSIGSSERDHSVETEVLGVPFKVERIGTDGDVDRACEMIAGLDGKVDALGLGGTDLYITVGNKKYTLRSSIRMVRAAKKTPIYDGSVLKLSMEKEIVSQLCREGEYVNAGKKVLLVGAADRFGMAEGFHNCGCKMVYGDLMFNLGLPLPIRSMAALKTIAAIIAPVVSQMPIEMLYPTGDKQKTRTPKWEKYYEWADVVAGDFHMVYKYMPDDMRGKVIITNTTTAKNIQEFKKLGVATVITTTPEFSGRSFGTNVMEGVYSTILGKTRDNPPTVEEFRSLLKKQNIRPNITHLNGPGA